MNKASVIRSPDDRLSLKTEQSVAVKGKFPVHASPLHASLPLATPLSPAPTPGPPPAPTPGPPPAPTPAPTPAPVSCPRRKSPRPTGCHLFGPLPVATRGRPPCLSPHIPRLVWRTPLAPGRICGPPSCDRPHSHYQLCRDLICRRPCTGCLVRLRTLLIQ